MAFIARKDSNCDGCARPIVAGVSPIKWSRKNPSLRGKFFHSECFPTGTGFTESETIESETETESTSSTASFDAVPHHTSMDNYSLAQVMAGALQPFITANSDDIDKRIDAKIEAAMSTIAPVIHERTIIVKDGATIGSIEGTQHKLFPKLMKKIAKRKNCYLWGDAGSGKTTAASKIASALGLPFYYIALNEQMTATSITGFVDGNGDYVPSDFFMAYTQGGVFLIDELELGRGNLLASLNGALANGHASFPRDKHGKGGMQKRHPDFIAVGTGNTNMLGPTLVYSDRKAMDGSIRERFHFIEWNTDPALELASALAVNPHATHWVEWVQAVRASALAISPRLLVTQRASIEGAEMLADGEDIREVADDVLFKGFKAVDVQSILNRHPLPTCYAVGGVN